MTEDELSALRWLHKGDARARAVGIAPGLAALIRLLEVPLLKGATPLNLDIRNALASALRPAGVSEMKLVLELKTRRRPGRPPKNVENALEAVEREDRLVAGKAAGEKQEALIASESCSRSKILAESRGAEDVGENNSRN